MLEIELKFRIDDPAALRDALRRRSGTDAPTVAEENWILDDAQGSLWRSDRGLRVRRTRAASGDTIVTLTVKGARERLGALKKREEREVAVSSKETEPMLALLALLGYQPRVIFEKRRATYEFDDCTVCLDEIPRLGHWLEIEGPSESAVRALQEQLELPNTAIESETYVGLATGAVAPNADGCHVLRFDDRDPSLMRETPTPP